MILESLRIIAGLILILFIPGYALTWAFYPKKQDLSWTERIALSFALSISGVMLTTLFADLVMGMDTTPLNIVILIITLTLLSVLIWKVHIFIINNNINQKIIYFMSDQVRKKINRFLKH